MNKKETMKAKATLARMAGKAGGFYFETIRDGYDDFGFEYKYLLHALQASRMSIK